MRLWMLILCITIISTSVIGQNKVIDFRNCLWLKGFNSIEVSSIQDTIAYIIPNSVPDSVILNCLSQEYIQFANGKYKERNPHCYNCHLYDPIQNNHYPQVKLNYKEKAQWLEISDFSPLKNFQNNLYFTVSYPRHFPIRTIAIAKDPDYEIQWKNKSSKSHYLVKKEYKYLKKRDQFNYYELHHDTIKLSYADFKYVLFERGCFNRMELDTIPFLPNDTIHYSIDKYDYDLHTSAYKDARRQYHYMPSSILKFQNAKIMHFEMGLYNKLNVWIPRDFHQLEKIESFGYNIFIPEKEKKRILKNKNFKHLSYYYPFELNKFEKELPDELFEMDSLKTIYINGDVKNIMKLRKMRSLEKIHIYKYINPLKKTYDTTAFEFVLSEEDKKWMKQHKKLYKLHKVGLLGNYFGGFQMDRFKTLKDVWFYGFSKLYYAPAKELPYSTIVLNPATIKNFEYHGKRFFVSDSIKTLKLEIFGMNEWQNPNLSAEWYRNYFIFHQNVKNMSDSDKQEIIDKYYLLDVKRAEENSLQHVKITFRNLPKQIRHLDDVERITMSGYDYDFPFVFSKFFLKMKALKEIKLYVRDNSIKERRYPWRQEAIDSDKYDNKDLSKFKGIDEKEYEIIRKLRKKGVNVYYEKIYS